MFYISNLKINLNFELKIKIENKGLEFKIFKKNINLLILNNNININNDFSFIKLFFQI